MNKVLTLLFCLFTLTLQAQFKPVGASSGGAPNVTTISPGATLASVNWRNDTAYQLGAGTYSITPSILISNLNAGNTFTGWTLRNITNSSIEGVYGQTRIDGSSAPGEVLFATNCSNLRLSKLRVIGWTNHNVNVLPLNGLIYAGLLYAATDNLTVEDCIIERHFDHGIADAAAGVIEAARLPVMSTNVFLRRNYLTDIGSFRTNTAGGVSRDGTAIVPTGGVVEDNTVVGCLRGIEPYTDAVGVNKPFRIEVRRNRLINMVDSAMPNFGTTNMHNSTIEFNRLYNDATFNYHGSNYGVTFAWSTSGIFISGGRANVIRGNMVEGSFLYAYAMFNSASKLDDCSITDNYAIDINTRGGQGYGFYLGEPGNTAANADSLRRATIARNKAIRTQDVGFALWAGRDINFYNNEVYNCNLANSGTTFGAGMLFGYDGFSTALLTNINAWENTVYTDTANAPAIPFYVADNVRQSSFTDNRVLTNGAATAASASAGWTNRSGNNVTILGPVRTYNSSVNLAAIGANAAVDTVISAPGVTTNDAVTVQLPAQFWTVTSGEVSVLAWATNSSSSDGQIVMRTINADSGAGTGDFPSVNAIFHVRQVRVAGQ